MKPTNEIDAAAERLRRWHSGDYTVYERPHSNDDRDCLADAYIPLRESHERLVTACEELLERLAVKERQIAGHRLGRMPEKVFEELSKTSQAEVHARAALAAIPKEPTR